MSAMMTVIYDKQTQHVLAARRRVTPGNDALEDVVAEDGLQVAGARFPVPPTGGGTDYGAPVGANQRVVVPRSELAVASLNLDLDVLRRPFRYVSDGTSAAALPLNTDRFRIAVDGVNVIIGHPVLFPFPQQLVFNQDTKFFIQVEGPTPADRRVMTGTLPHGSYNSQSFPLTTDSGMKVPLAASTPTSSYSILVLVEGWSADLRTAQF
jgi:hypothetical protein